MTNKGFIELNVDEMYFAEWNYKNDDEVALQKLKANIKRNGMIENLIVRETDNGFEVVNGNHRLQAIRELGIEKVHVFNLGKISTSDAKRIAIETNETKFHNDNVRLAEILKDISEDYDLSELAETMPYTEEELDSFTKILDFNWDNFTIDDNDDGFSNAKFDENAEKINNGNNNETNINTNDDTNDTEINDMFSYKIICNNQQELEQCKKIFGSEGYIVNYTDIREKLNNA